MHVILRGTSLLPSTAHSLQHHPPLSLHEPLILLKMTGQSTPSQVTPYLILLVFIATLGPLQFGYHLVCIQGTSPPYREKHWKLFTNMLCH
jgi:hypothetical protein